MKTLGGNHWAVRLIVGCALAWAAGTEAAVHLRMGPVEYHEESRRGRVQELIVVGQDALIPEGTTNRDVVAFMGNVEVHGVVEGDLVVVLGNLTLGPNARVERDLVLVGGALEADPGADYRESGVPRILAPAWVASGLSDWIGSGVFWARPLSHRPGLSWWIAGGFLGMYALLTVFFPGTIKRSVETMEAKPAITFLAGLLTVLLVGPLVFLLVVSFIGWPLVPVVACALVVALWIGKASVCAVTGHRVARSCGLAFLDHPLPALLAGGVLIGLLYMVPLLGIFVAALTSTLGLGAVILAAFDALRAELPEPGSRPSPPPIAVQSTNVPGDASTQAVEPVYMPRAGFWIRLGASVLDLILVGAIAAAFGRDMEEAFLALWLLYHLCMWWWKGTTIGGIVFGLRIVRLDGRAIGFGVALVRCLASIFSALAFFVGFFWVGWNREKQSWHDIIAGTVIVRLPRGTSLI